MDQFIDISSISRPKKLTDAVKLHLESWIEDRNIKQKMSCYLSDKIGNNYTYLNNIFSKHENTSIREYMIGRRIEKAEKMLLEGYSLIDICVKLGFSSEPHLSNQFKKIKGMNIRNFKFLN